MRRAAWLFSASLAFAAAPALADAETTSAGTAAETPAAAAQAPAATASATHASVAVPATHVPATAPAAHRTAPLTHASASAPAAQKPAAAASVTATAAPEPAPPVVAPAPTPAPVPAAAAAPSAVSPAWLRTDKPVAKRPLEMQQGPSPLRVGGMLLLVAGLGGVAWYAKKKRQGVTPAAQKAQLRVLGTTRIGAKASAVVVEVAGKRLLLGVTDQNVSNLAWLDDEPNAALEDASEASGIAGGMPHGAYAPDDVAAAGPSGFLRLLRNAVGTGAAQRVAPPSHGRQAVAADEIAHTTRDEVRLSRREPEEPVAFEGQVMGLAKRRKESL